MTTRVLLLVGVLLGFGFLCSAQEKQADWQNAVDALQKRGGKFKQESPDKPPHSLDLTNPRDLKDGDLAHLKALPSLKKLTFYHHDAVTAEGLANLKGMANLNELCLCGITASGKGMAHLEGLTELETLHLGNTPVTDDDLARLKGLKKLRSLQLYNTKVTGSGLKSLSEPTRLEVLSLARNTAVTDEGVKNLATMTGLRHLYLNDTNITDKSVESLKQLKSLESVDLSKTNLTAKGVKDLQTALPKARISN